MVKKDNFMNIIKGFQEIRRAYQDICSTSKIGKKHLQRAGTYSTEELAKILQSILDGDD